MTPYLAFWVPAHLGGSGVLATVACGLYVSWNGPRLIPSATRLQGIFFWDLIVYLIEGLVFLVTGLQARALIEQGARFLDPRTADRDRLDDADRHRGALHLGVSGHLYSALGRARGSPGAIRRRRGRRRFSWPSPAYAAWFARRRARHSLRDRQRPAVSAPRPDSVRHLRRHHHHAGRPRLDAAVRGALARAEPARQKRAQRRDQGRTRAPARPRCGRSRSGCEKLIKRARPAGRGDRTFAHAQSKPHADTAERT